MPHIPRDSLDPREPIDTLNRYTFITLVKYHPNMGPEQLETYLKDKMVKGGFMKTIKINLVAVTFGIYDSVFIWQAENMDDAKRFRDNPSAAIGAFTTLVASKNDGW